MVTVVVILLAMTAVAAILTSRAIDGLFPSTAGVAYAASAQHPGGVASGYTDLLVAEMDEAWKRSDWATAIETLSEILAIDSSNTSIRGRLYQAHVNLGWRLLVDRRFDEAQGQFSDALEIDASGSEAREGLRLLEQLIVPAGGPSPTAQAPVVLTPIPQPTASCPPPVSTPVVVPTAVPEAAVTCPPQTAVAPACPSIQVAPTQSICIVVRTGDTLYGLARRFGTTVEAIMAANCLQTTTILIGQKLLIPVCPTQVVCAPVSAPVSVPVCSPVSIAVCPTVCPPVSAPVCPPVSAPVLQPVVTTSVLPVHVVQRGEDLFHIALRYQVSALLLMQVNGLSGTTLKAGQTLIIP
jgi:LysM repeat protein